MIEFGKKLLIFWCVLLLFSHLYPTPENIFIGFTSFVEFVTLLIGIWFGGLYMKSREARFWRMFVFLGFVYTVLSLF